MKEKILAPLALFLLFYNIASAKQLTLYVSPAGDNGNTGLTIDEPLKDIQQALDKVPGLRKKGNDTLMIRLLEGTYFLSDPLKIRPRHSGTAKAPVIVHAWAGDKVVISGGIEINGWERTPEGWWKTRLPEGQPGYGDFRQIYMDGQLRCRARIPNEGFKIVAGFPEGTPKTVGYHTDCQSFEFAPGDIDPDWKNLGDVEVIVYHFWTDSHLPILSVDTNTNIVTFRHKAGKVFTDDFTEDGARYIVENVFEGLDAPGEWYFDRPSRELYYYPFPEENIRHTTCIIPVTERLVDIQGDPLRLDFVSGIKFENITFEFSDFVLPEGSSNDGQGAMEISAAVRLEGARHCSFVNCEFRNLSNWAVEILNGSNYNYFKRNKIHHVSAGGIRVNGGDEKSHPLERTGHMEITDNEIANYGQVYPSAVGILLMQTHSNEVSHNHIHHGYYTAISVGWEWGYQRSISRDNRIGHNHIHDIGQGLLSDMGAIYTLGVSPGTVIFNNLIHDIEANRYGGWGIYNDEGSSYILVENNVVYNTKFSGYNVNSSKAITVRNNIFALGRLNQLSRNQMEEHQSFYFENNIVYWKEGELLDGRWEDQPYTFYFRSKRQEEVTSTFEMNYNLFFNPGLKREEIDFSGKDFGEWQKSGKDTHSLYADPLFKDPAHGDFNLLPDSPAFKLGFKPINMINVGPRERTGLLH